MGRELFAKPNQVKAGADEVAYVGTEPEPLENKYQEPEPLENKYQEPDPLENKYQEPEPLENKYQEPEPQKKVASPQPCKAELEFGISR